MKRIFILLILFGLNTHSTAEGYFSPSEHGSNVGNNSATPIEAFRSNLSDVQVSGAGVII